MKRPEPKQLTMKRPKQRNIVMPPYSIVLGGEVFYLKPNRAALRKYRQKYAPGGLIKKAEGEEKGENNG